MHVIPPPHSVQALMLGLAVLLGVAIGRVLFAPRFPNEVFGLMIGLAPIGWLLAFVGALVLRDPTNTGDGPRPFPDWRAMEYMGWIHVAAYLLGLILLAAIYKSPPQSEKASLGFKTVLLFGVSLLICHVLINTAGFIATTLWVGKGSTVLPMIGYLIFALAGFTVCLGVLRNQISGDGPRWLRGAR